MRHGRSRGRLGLVQEHRTSLLRNLARSLILHQRIITTHGRAKETSRFVDQLVTTAKKGTLHARRNLVQRLGSGSEVLAKRLIESIAPKLGDRNGGYTRVLRYKIRAGDGASLSLLEFSVPVVETEPKKLKKKKEPKPPKPAKEKKVQAPAVRKPHDKEDAEKAKKHPKTGHEPEKEELKKEAPKKGGFLSSLRRFLKGDDDKK